MMRSRVLAFATIAIAFGCSSDRVTDPVTPLGLDLSIAPKTDTLYLDTTAPSQPTVQLNATATSMGNPIALPAGRVFASDNASVASVDSLTGLVQATGVGTAQVSVRVNAVKAFATIVVLPIVQSVQVTASATQALAGDTISVTATVLGWQGQPLTGQPLTFSSSSPAAKVSPTGQVVFSGPGTATITATSGAAKASVALTALAREFVGGAAGSISSGMDATCGLLPLGRTFCFGLAPITGVAKDTSCFGGSPSDPLKCTLVPLQIANNLQLTTLAMGDSVACGLGGIL